MRALKARWQWGASRQNCLPVPGMLRVRVSWMCLTVVYLTVDMIRRTELTSARVSFMSTTWEAYMTPGEVIDVLQVGKKYFSFFRFPLVRGVTGEVLSFTARTGHALVRFDAGPMPVARRPVCACLHAIFTRVRWPYSFYESPGPPSRAFLRAV